MERRTVAVDGMSCGGCETAVENALRNLDGVARVDAEHETDTVDVVAADGVTDDDLRAAVDGAGYDVRG